MSIVVGGVIGSGIFLVPSTMIQKVGSVDMLFAVWICGGLLTLAGALCYAELSTAMPEAGGGYVFLRETYGPLWGFIYAWTITWVGKSGAAATLGTALFYYLAHFFPGLERVLVTVPYPIGPGGEPLEITHGQVLAMAVILALALINYIGVKSGGRVQVVGTVAKVGLILGIVAAALVSGEGDGANYAAAMPAAGGVSGFFAALVAALWAYEGWADLSYVASEVKEPRKNLPRSLIGGTLIIISVYAVTNLAYFYILSPAEVGVSDRVAATMMERVAGGTGAGIVSIAAMISIFAALNATLLTSPRVAFAAAQDGLFFRAMGHVHAEHRTPSTSILVIGAWSALLVFSGRYENLFTYVVVATWLLYGMTTAAVIVLRKKRPDMPRPYRTLGYPVVPILFVLVAAGMFVSTLLDSPRETLMGLTLILGGLPFYFYWKRRRKYERRGA